MQRQLQQILQGRETSDGAGVRIKRSLGQHQHARFDPFLMLDEFGSNSADDYIAGFPSHPHRGFETVTYMLDGHMLHEDHLGNQGLYGLLFTGNSLSGFLYAFILGGLSCLPL